MPIYTYRCNNCYHQFEKRQRMSENPLTECPVCAGHVRRVVNSVGIVFKGKGFYVTDNRNGRSANGSDQPVAQKKDKETKSADNSHKKSSTPTKKTADTAP